MSIITQFKTAVENAVGYPTPLLSTQEAITESGLIVKNVNDNFNLLNNENQTQYGYNTLVNITKTINDNHGSITTPKFAGVEEQRRVNNLLFEQQSLQKDFNSGFAYLTSDSAPKAENAVLDAAHALRDARIKADQAHAESIAKAKAAVEKANSRLEKAEDSASTVISNAQAKADEAKAKADEIAARAKAKADQTVDAVINSTESLIDRAAEDVIKKEKQAEQACKYEPAVLKLTDEEAPEVAYVEGAEIESALKNKIRP